MSLCPWLEARCSGVSSPRFITLMRAPRMISMSTTALLPSLHAQWRGLNPWSSLKQQSEFNVQLVCSVLVKRDLVWEGAEHNSADKTLSVWCSHWNTKPVFTLYQSLFRLKHMLPLTARGLKHIWWLAEWKKCLGMLDCLLTYAKMQTD